MKTKILRGLTITLTLFVLGWMAVSTQNVRNANAASSSGSGNSNNSGGGCCGSGGSN